MVMSSSRRVIRIQRRTVLLGGAGASCAQSRVWKRLENTANAGALLDLRRQEREDAVGALDVDPSNLEAQGRAYLAKNEATRIERNVDFLEDTLGWKQDRVFLQRASVTVQNLEQEVDFWTKGLGMSTSRKLGPDVDGACVSTCVK